MGEITGITWTDHTFKQWGAYGGDQTLHHGGDFLDGHQWHEFPEA